MIHNPAISINRLAGETRTKERSESASCAINIKGRAVGLQKTGWNPRALPSSFLKTK